MGPAWVLEKGVLCLQEWGSVLGVREAATAIQRQGCVCKAHCSTEG